MTNVRWKVQLKVPLFSFFLFSFISVKLIHLKIDLVVLHTEKIPEIIRKTHINGAFVSVIHLPL